MSLLCIEGRQQRDNLTMTLYFVCFPFKDAHSVFGHSLMVCSMSLKVANTANMTFKYCLHPAAENVVNLSLVVSSRQCLPLGIRPASAVQCATRNLLTVGLFATAIELCVMNVMPLTKQFCQEDTSVSSASKQKPE